MAMHKFHKVVPIMVNTEKQRKAQMNQTVLNVCDIPSDREITFDIVFNAKQRAETRNVLSLLELKNYRFSGKLTPRGKNDWDMTGKLGATATQACVVTLETVQTRIDDLVNRTFYSHWEEPDEGSVSEMDENVESEPLLNTIDLGLIAREALALSLPDYPRKENVKLEEAVFTEPGVSPMTDKDAKPFAGLADLKKKLGKGS